ncbi:MAG TPA: SDR family oxidoreductase [Solirubrobacterales bacterium]
MRVNAVAPSLVDTPMTQAMPPDVPGEARRPDPGRPHRHPDDVAGIVAFLTSPDAAYISGQVIYACGGRTLAP